MSENNQKGTPISEPIPIELEDGTHYFDAVTGQEISNLFEPLEIDSDEEELDQDYLDDEEEIEDEYDHSEDDESKEQGSDDDDSQGDNEYTNEDNSEDSGEPKDISESPGDIEESLGKGAGESATEEAAKGAAEGAAKAGAEAAAEAGAEAAASAAAETAAAGAAQTGAAAALPELLPIIAVILIVVIVVVIFALALIGTGDETAVANPCTSGGTTIVIDPGHITELDSSSTQAEYDADKAAGRGTMGTSGNGVVERVVNQQVANLLKTELEARGYTALLTKTSADDFMSNRARGQFARDNNAALIIKIHNDGDGPSDGMIFYHSNASVVASKKNNMNEIGEYPSRRTDETIQEDINLANALNEAFAAGINSYGIKYSDGTNYKTAVLEHPGNNGFGYTYDIPTSLVEMASLLVAKDAAFIGNAVNQANVAKAIADGIESYLPASSIGSSGCLNIRDGERDDLAREVLSHPNITFQSNEARDIDPDKCYTEPLPDSRMTKCVQKPVLQFLLAMADAGQNVEVSTLIRDHNYMTASGSPSKHSSGLAVDIGNDDQFLVMMKWITSNLLSSSIAPRQVLCAGADLVYGNGVVVPEIDNLSVDKGAISPGFTSKYVGDHTNHIHVGY